MSRLPAVRFSRSALLLIAVVSAAATFVILHGSGGRTPAQMAALVALRDRPHTPVATPTAATSTAPTGHGSAGGGTSSASTGGGGGSAFSGGSTSGGSSGSGGGSALPVTSVNSSASPTPNAPTTPTTPTTSGSTGAKAKKSDLPKVKHVFEIMLSAPKYGAAFGHGSKLSALHELIHKGTLLSHYQSLGDGELPDELAAVSGQAPNHDTKLGCASYADFPTAAVANKAGIVPGKGCVYPDTALTIGDEVTASGATWGAYVADMGKETCVHPNSDAADNVLPTGAEPGYDTRHNPFIYFHSLLDLGDCSSDDVDLGLLPKALAKPAETPVFAYVAPDACADGDAAMATSTTGTSTTGTSTTGTTTTATTPATTSTSATTAEVTTTADATTTVGVTTTADVTTVATTTTTAATTPTTSTTGTTTTPTTPAVVTTPEGCPDGSPAGIKAENAFLKTWVPRVLHSAAYRHDGVLVIAFTRSGAATGHPVRTGALILSPDGRRGARIATAQNPYSLLRFDEDALRLTPLAHSRLAKGLAAAVLRPKH